MPALVTAQDAAHYTGRPVGTIWRWASEGRISRHGHGRRVRYDVLELSPRLVDDTTGQVTPGAVPPLPEGARAA